MQQWSGSISILVPVYNAARWLPACADSVLLQNDPNFELVLVDDGSTDESPALCDALAAAHPGRVRVCHQENRGLILARRCGIALAAGELCLFLDADDMLAAGSLMRIREAIGQTGADIVIFNYDNLYEPSGEVETDEVIFQDGSLFEGESKRKVYEETIASWRLNNLCMKAIKTALLRADDTPYNDYAHLRLGEDLLQSLYPVTHAKRIVYLASPLYIYRHQRDSMIGGAGPGAKADDAIMARLVAYMRLWDMDTPDMRALYARRQLGNVLTDFFQSYRMAGSREERRAVIEGNRKLPPVLAPYCTRAVLGTKKYMQMRALLGGNRPLLWLIERIGGRKLRKQYGKN